MNWQDVKESDWLACRCVQDSGVCNMLSSQVRKFAGFSEEIHLTIMKHYSELREKFEGED